MADFIVVVIFYFYMKIFFPNGSFLKSRKYAIMCVHTMFSYRPCKGKGKKLLWRIRDDSGKF